MDLVSEDPLPPQLLTDEHHPPSTSAVVLDSAGSASTTAAAVNDGSSDDTTSTGDLILSLSKTTFSCADAPLDSVTLTVRDEAGNTDTAVAAVNLVDNQDPTIVAISSSTQVLGPSGTFTLTSSDVASSITDNCDIKTEGLSKSAFTCQDAVGGAQEVILFVLDTVRLCLRAPPTTLPSLPLYLPVTRRRSTCR